MAAYFPKNGVEYIFYVALESRATPGTFQANPTLAAGDVKISKDGGAFANLNTLPAVDPASGRGVKVTVSAAEMTCDNVQILFVDAAGAEWYDLQVAIQPQVRSIADLAYPATSGRSMVVDASGLVDANAVKVGPSGSGTAQTARDVGGQLDAAMSTRAAASALATAQTDLDTLTGSDGATLATAQALYAPAKAGDAMALTSSERTTLAAVIWNALTSGMSTVGSIGKKLADWTIHSAADVWASVTRTLTAATNITSTGGTTVPQTGDSFARLGAPAGASVSADVAAAKVDTAAIKAKTDNLPTDPADESALEALIDALPTNAELATALAAADDATLAAIAALSIPTAAQNAAALMDLSNGVETSITPRQALRLILAASAGKLSGAATTTVVIRNVGDAKDRITATVDADGNRSAVTVDAT